MTIEHLSKKEEGKEMQQIEGSILKQAKKEGVERLVVGGIIDRDEKVLLLRRKPNEFMEGVYELPSGKVEKSESLRQALLREIEEETGLKVKKIGEYIGSFDYKSSSGEKTRQFNFVAEVENKEVRLNVAEHDDLIWIEPATLERCKITESVQRILRNFWKKRENK